ncbi:tetratricopeptide repeat protein [Niveibacterium terrae]|uniref:tetratricopeptide repeat protein n=1 Tax=Niveibacterium terrae TaxID=3373598 RepID=UPI003A8EF29D
MDEMQAQPAQPCSDAEVLFLEGCRRMEDGDGEAEGYFRKALALAPDLAEAWINLGLLFDQRGEPEAAETCYRRAMELAPGCAEVPLNLGGLLINAKRFAEAGEICQKAVALAPASAPAWTNLGVLKACLHLEEDAESCYRTALALEAGHPEALFNLSYILLRQGRFAEGWSCLEARPWYQALAARLPFPRWQGEDIHGRAILIGIEAGHGDMIQLCRYATELKVRGAKRVGLLCHPGLKALFATLTDVDAVIPVAGQMPDLSWDFWVPPLSLPYRCETRLETIPAHLPYLAAPADRVEKWAALALPEGVRVGLVWRGNPKFENDADRSLPSLGLLAPLWSVPGARFISLQKGAGEDEARRPPEGLALLALGGELDDFADTAALIERLDLLICVDTAVAHLAGALGKPCWVLLPDHRTDWRWLTGRSDSPWYPGALRLFRQTETGWEAVIAEVATALEAFVGDARGC